MRDPIRLIFFHGLNTYGDAAVHIGPLRIGQMAKHWKNQLHQRFSNVEFIALEALGCVSIADQAERAVRQIESLIRQEKLVRPIHFLGQSTGGLVARRVASEAPFRQQVRSVITIGTPHHGSGAAEYALRVADEKTALRRLLKPALRLAGYDVDKKTQMFRELTQEALVRFNSQYPPSFENPCESLVCALPRSKIAWPLHFLYDLVHSSMPGESDGFVSLSSQTLDIGNGHAPSVSSTCFALDHFSELGYCLAPRPSDRAQAVKEFNRLVDTVVQIASMRNDLSMRGFTQN